MNKTALHVHSGQPLVQSLEQVVLHRVFRFHLAPHRTQLSEKVDSQLPKLFHRSKKRDFPRSST
ncbi:hypothetical protein T11_4053 [Trichinella zimbabwensis]|uniref:Uncharacterized protein n=1 Tax=Trichinella zimbabwensis TaxID=268475 RepID=A0A0V1H763_9BILA|nr:hypothetical protein T11_4053 [Trichinella zimbabwensis]